MALLGFGRARPENRLRKQAELWVREAGGLGSEVVVKVNELVCSDPACPGLETVILIMRPGRRSQAAKLAKPLSEVSREEIGRAVLGLN